MIFSLAINNINLLLLFFSKFNKLLIKNLIIIFILFLILASYKVILSKFFIKNFKILAFLNLFL